MTLNDYAKQSHLDNIRWWVDINKHCSPCGGSGAGGLHSPVCKQCWGTGHPSHQRNVGELLMLCVSELAEAMEGHRKGLQDDKLPHRTMFEVELADCLIRIFDLAGAHGLDLEGAYQEKRLYNAGRADHKIENRLKPGGKKY